MPDLPFARNQIWTYTGGPHTGWGSGEPFAAIDFAPPSEFHGCFTVDPPNYAVAAADGLVVRSDINGLALDLDGDGDERTGWHYVVVDSGARRRAVSGEAGRRHYCQRSYGIDLYG